MHHIKDLRGARLNVILRPHNMSLMKHSNFNILAQLYILSLLLADPHICVLLWWRSVLRLRRLLEMLHDGRYLVLKQFRTSPYAYPVLVSCYTPPPAIRSTLSRNP